MKESPKEYAEKLINSIDKILFENSTISKDETQMDYEQCTKDLAIFCIRSIYNFGANQKLREPLTYLNQVETEINKL